MDKLSITDRLTGKSYQQLIINNTMEWGPEFTYELDKTGTLSDHLDFLKEVRKKGLVMQLNLLERERLADNYFNFI